MEGEKIINQLKIKINYYLKMEIKKNIKVNKVFKLPRLINLKENNHCLIDCLRILVKVLSKIV